MSLGLDEITGHLDASTFRREGSNGRSQEVSAKSSAPSAAETLTAQRMMGNKS
jgi:hypothetical protein